MTRTPHAPPAWLVAGFALLTLPHLGTVQADADLWWHVRTGQWIWATAAVPRVDPWSYTAPGPWVDHNWLAHLVLASAWGTLGDTGLLLVRDLALVLAVVAFGWAMWYRWPNPVGTLGLVSFSVPLVAVFVNVRPQGWTYAFLAATLALAGAARRGSIAAVWALPVLLVLWVNIHGGFPVGWGLAGLYLLALCVGDGGTSSAAGSRRGAILLAMAALAIAPLVSPYGLDILRYVVTEVGTSHGTVFEWQPPTGLLRAWGIAWVVGPLVALAVTVGRRPRWSAVWPVDLAALGVGAVLMLRSAKFLVFVVLVGPIVLASALAELEEPWARAHLPILVKASHSRGWALVVMGLGVFFGLVSELPAVFQRPGHVIVAPGTYPQAAMRFLAQQPVGPRLATNLVWGGFAIWHVGDRYRVSMDGRNTSVYPPAFVDRYLHAWYSGDLGEVLAGHGADAVLVETGGALYATLKRKPDWALAFQSPVGSVFAPASRWTRPPLILREEGGTGVFPG